MSNPKKITLLKLKEQMERFNYEFQKKELIHMLNLLASQKTSPKTVEEIKSFAKIIQEYSKELSLKIKNTHCLNILSQLYFGKDWNTVSALLNENSIKEYDVEVEIDEKLNVTYHMAFGSGKTMFPIEFFRNFKKGFDDAEITNALKEIDTSKALEQMVSRVSKGNKDSN